MTCSTTPDGGLGNVETVLFLKASSKDIVSNKPAFQWTIPHWNLGGGFQADVFQSHSVIGDEPALITLEVVLQGVADVLIHLVDVIFLQTVAVRWVDDDDTAFFGRGEVFHVFLYQVDVVLQMGVVDIAFGDGHGLG